MAKEETKPQQKIKFNLQELSLAYQAINIDDQNKQINYPLAELPTATMAVSKIVKHTDKDGKFQDGEVEFTTEEKALILKKLDRGWPAGAGEHILSLKEKVS